MKKLFLFLPLALLLVACEKEAPDKKDEPAIPAEVKYYPTEVVRVTSARPDTIATRYTYNGNQQVAREDTYQQGVLQSYILYTYTPAGHLLQKRYFAAGNRPTEVYAFELNSAGQLTRLSHSNVDAAGIAGLHHYSTYRYTDAGKLEELAEFTPSDQLVKKIAFQQAGPAIEKVQSFRNNNSLEFSSQSTYDLRKHPFSATVLHTNNLPGNVTHYSLTDESNQDTTTITSTITYNEAGYPLKIVQTYSDGRVLTDTYTYMQR